MVFLWDRIVIIIRRLTSNKKTRPYFYIATAIILLLIVGLSIKLKSNKSSTNFNLNQAQGILRDAESDEQNAENAVLAKDNDKAKIFFASSIDKAGKIQNLPIVGSDAKDVLNKAYSGLDKLTNTTRFNNLSPIFSTKANPTHILVSSGYIYLTLENSIYRGSEGGAPEKITATPSGENIQFGLSNGSNLYFYTSSQKIYELDTTTNKLSPVAVSGNWETANSGSFYSGNLYLLDGVIGQVYKHTSNATGFDAGSVYLTSKSVDLKNSNSIAIDGSVFVLNSSGNVLEFQKSKLQDFSLKNIPAPDANLNKAIKLYTDSDTPSLYVLDNGANRIVEFDKNGNFIRQYAFPSIGEITDFGVNIKAKKIWLLSGTNVYAIGI